ncbi:unnamed protein product, partial [Ixodes pacificus]
MHTSSDTNGAHLKYTRTERSCDTTTDTSSSGACNAGSMWAKMRHVSHFPRQFGTQHRPMSQYAFVNEISSSKTSTATRNGRTMTEKQATHVLSATRINGD